MSNERKTENLLEQQLRKNGFDENDFHFQGSLDEEIQRCLSSKKGNRQGRGKPEHIVRINGDAADILVTECKYDKKFHASAVGLNENSPLKPSLFAEDGVIHYMKGLKKDFNVIGLAVSGVEDLKITTFKAMRNGVIERIDVNHVLQKDDYLKILRQTDGYGEKSETEIIEFAKLLHEFLRDHMELSEAYKPLIVSGVLLALKNPSFEVSYRATASKDDLAENLVTAIKQTLKSNGVPNEKVSAMISGYDFIKYNKSVKQYLMPTVAKIYRHLFFALKEHTSLDVLGNFYGEFLRYSGGDQQGLGIVLTPRHITELFAELADLNPENSVVLDTCAGTGGFLISSMANMINKCKEDSALIERIKKEALIGVELDQHMFTLACANMIFRGDGKANMFWDDCLSPRELSTTQRINSLKPTVSMLNPPYSKKAKGKRELSFVKKAADLTIPGGLCLAIIPVNAINDDKKEIVSLKEEILQNHTLKAVMSMPPQLFPGVGTVTAIVVLETHKPHYKSLRGPNGKQVPKQNTWFGYWRDDGFTVNKNKRVEREEGIWNRIKSEWLDSYVNQEVYPSKSCKAAVTHLDEWVAEAYMETDYSLLTEKEFEQEIKKFALFNLMLDVEGASDLGEDNESQ